MLSRPLFNRDLRTSPGFKIWLPRERVRRKGGPYLDRIFPNEQSIIRIIGAILLEQNDEWQLQSCYMQVEAMTELNTQPNEAQTAKIPPRAA